MRHNRDFGVASSAVIEAVLGERLKSIRLSRNITQAALAREAGVSRSTLTRLERSDGGISLDSFIRIMQALQLHGHLEALLPEPGISPLARTETPGKKRRRARPPKAQKVDEPGSTGWTWGDESKAP